MYFCVFQSIEEKCVYTPNVDNKSWTVCERQAWINSSIFGLSFAIQKLGIERFKQNTSKTVKGFEHILNKMFTPENLMEFEQTKSSLNPKEKLKSGAKKATALAKSKAAPVMASVTGGRTAS